MIESASALISCESSTAWPSSSEAFGGPQETRNIDREDLAPPADAPIVRAAYVFASSTVFGIFAYLRNRPALGARGVIASRRR